MDKPSIRNRIETLRKKLHEHNYRYYVLSEPVISDYDYDMMINELIKLETENPEFYDANSPSQRVGNDINTEFNQIIHKYPMLSLGNTYNEGELRDFDNRVKKALNEPYRYVCELKYDGASISLTYENGKLRQGDNRTLDEHIAQDAPQVIYLLLHPGFMFFNHVYE